MKKKIPWIFPGLGVLLLDRVVKAFCSDVNGVLIPGVIALKSARNTGMALGLFQGGVWVILAVSVLLIIAAFFLLRDMRLSGWAPLGISLMAGGALGNMIDRIAYGYVMDMYELLFMDFYIFNTADVGVVAGAVICGVSLLFRPRDWSKK